MVRTEFLPIGIYEDIINHLGQWKVLDIKSLAELCNYEISYFNLLKKIRRLESEGLVRGVLAGRKNKHIYLTNKGLKFTKFDFTYEIFNENLTHDLIVGRVLRAFLKSECFTHGKMFHQISADHLLPDAEIDGLKDGLGYKLAIEIELTQKSEDRVKDKYSRYAQSDIFSYAIFITNKPGLFKTYKRFLSEMRSEVQEAIILMLDSALSVSKFNFKDGEYFYKGEKVSFKELFGNQKG